MDNPTSGIRIPLVAIEMAPILCNSYMQVSPDRSGTVSSAGGSQAPATE